MFYFQVGCAGQYSITPTRFSESRFPATLWTTVSPDVSGIRSVPEWTGGRQIRKEYTVGQTINGHSFAANVLLWASRITTSTEIAIER